MLSSHFELQIIFDLLHIFKLLEVSLQGKFLEIEFLGGRVSIFILLLDNAKFLSVEIVLFFIDTTKTKSTFSHSYPNKMYF